MNYRHAFHAGGFTDVAKHITLVRLIAYLKRKPTALRVIDTHAGTGRYDLTGEAARRSPEWRDGIGRLLERPLPAAAASLAEPYLALVRAENPDGPLTAYPGSPLIAKNMLRGMDRLTAAELHPDDAEALSALFHRDRQVQVVEDDGFTALNAMLPPPERRGLVLIDPPFEAPGEFERMASALLRAHKKFSTGTYALWYPLKDDPGLAGFLAALAASGVPKILRSELIVRAPADPPRLFGSGMVIVNPPHVLENELRVLLPALAERLGQDRRAGFRLDWVRGEG